jgi:hypothetical protein
MTPAAIDWLWPDRLVLGTLAVLDGDPQQGKSLLTLDWAARLTTGRSWPDGTATPGPSPVIYIGSEDNPERTVLPRLLAAGADTSRVHRFRVPQGNGRDRQPSFPDDCERLGVSIRKSGARLVIIDPFLAFLSGAAFSLNDQLIRRALDPLAEVAEQTGALLLLIRHLIKTGRARRALFCGIGAAAIVGSARTALLAGCHPDNEDCRLLAVTKSNLGPLPPTLSYRIARTDSGWPVIDWGEPVALTADEVLLAPKGEKGEVLEKAVAFLRELLSHGPVRGETARRLAGVEGLSQRTLERARAELNVVCSRQCEGDESVIYWSLPPDLDSQRIMRDLFGPDFKPQDPAG